MASSSKSPGQEPAGPAGRLDRYRRKRDFAGTPEPAGEPRGDGPPAGRPRFVVQRHRARRLHYDLRLEMGGVLASWAVPRGPTLDPAARRMAVHVEDHPLEYLDFEGVIPPGQYGAGDVIVWDIGTWAPHGTDDPVAAVAAGELHADVFGRKLRGRLVLIRREEPQWLLLHKRDAETIPGWDPEEHPRSVLSGRTNDEVRAAPERVWRSGPPAGRAGTAGTAGTAEPAVRAPAGTELAALDELGPSGVWEVYGRRLRLTNLDKPLFPAAPGRPATTKRDLVRYAALVAPTVLPYLAGRALNMHRFPDGAQAPGFWHKQVPAHAPDWVTRWRPRRVTPGRTTAHLVVDSPATLVWAANFGALEWHAWTAPVDAPDHPSYALIDLDPGTGTAWEEVLLLARLHRTALEHLGVTARPKVTGRRGIQIWVPVAPGTGFEETRDWVAQLSRAVGAVVPDLVSWKWEVRERAGRARLDYTQNAPNKTLVAPYSPRAAAGAPVSAPIDWDELDDPALRPDGFTIHSVLRRLAERGDPFRAVLAAGQPLPPVT
ncbi:bifunctional non-homologous end joining protein LigD [Frankia sp. EI5c]|uniref:non-homologous end-joining DNA ligase LigD n=1 Tax=Frankia sp. EI5c TaxID=683316 RepID=UPI0007C3844D|nr:DNA polymerase ligase N-terminal domain-containing protein [Frankia sp. EI5c]OAA25866.1 bifunctional non-homologous end joining protein LigD [Frankia sp. EI5c]